MKTAAAIIGILALLSGAANAQPATQPLLELHAKVVSWGLVMPIPPVASKMKDVRYLDIHEGEFDEVRIARWVKQAAKLPGWEP